MKILAGALVNTVPGFRKHDKSSISLGYMRTFYKIVTHALKFFLSLFRND